MNCPERKNVYPKNALLASSFKLYKLILFNISRISLWLYGMRDA